MNEDFDPFRENEARPFGGREIPVIPPGILANTPEAQHQEDFQKLDRRELARMSDKALAAWQSEFKQGEAQWRLAEHEWQRRITAEQIRASLILGRQSAIFAVVGSVAGAIVGVILTLMVQLMTK